MRAYAKAYAFWIVFLTALPLIAAGISSIVPGGGGAAFTGNLAGTLSVNSTGTTNDCVETDSYGVFACDGNTSGIGFVGTPGNNSSAVVLSAGPVSASVTVDDFAQCAGVALTVNMSVTGPVVFTEGGVNPWTAATSDGATALTLQDAIDLYYIGPQFMVTSTATDTVTFFPGHSSMVGALDYITSISSSEGAGDDNPCLDLVQPGVMGDVYLQGGGVILTGTVIMNTLRITDPGTALDTCDSSVVGKVFPKQGTVGVADTLNYCKKNAADVYAYTDLLSPTSTWVGTATSNLNMAGYYTYWTGDAVRFGYNATNPDFILIEDGADADIVLGLTFGNQSVFRRDAGGGTYDVEFDNLNSSAYMRTSMDYLTTCQDLTSTGAEACITIGSGNTSWSLQASGDNTGEYAMINLPATVGRRLMVTSTNTFGSTNPALGDSVDPELMVWSDTAWSTDTDEYVSIKSYANGTGTANGRITVGEGDLRVAVAGSDLCVYESVAGTDNVCVGHNSTDAVIASSTGSVILQGAAGVVDIAEWNDGSNNFARLSLVGTGCVWNYDDDNAIHVDSNCTSAASTIIDVGNQVQIKSTAARAISILDTDGSDDATLTVANGVYNTSLRVPANGYLEIEEDNNGAPPAGDCDADAEKGRMAIDSTNFRVYVCMGLTRGWDYAALTD